MRIIIKGIMVWCFVTLLIIAVVAFSAVAVVPYRKGNKALDETKRIENNCRELYFSDFRGNCLREQVNGFNDSLDKVLARMSRIESYKGDGHTDMGDIERFKGSVLAFKKLVSEIKLRSELLENLIADYNLEAVSTHSLVDSFATISAFLVEKLEDLCRIFYQYENRIKTEEKEK